MNSRCFCNQHPSLVPKQFHLPQKEPYPYEAIIPHSAPGNPINLFSVSMDLPILDISYQWNHMMCGLSCSASFTYHHLFGIHPPCISTRFLCRVEQDSAVWLDHVDLCFNKPSRGLSCTPKLENHHPAVLGTETPGGCASPPPACCPTPPLATHCRRLQSPHRGAANHPRSPSACPTATLQGCAQKHFQSVRFQLKCNNSASF